MCVSRLKPIRGETFLGECVKKHDKVLRIITENTLRKVITLSIGWIIALKRGKKNMSGILTETRKGTRKGVGSLILDEITGFSIKDRIPRRPPLTGSVTGPWSTHAIG